MLRVRRGTNKKRYLRSVFVEVTGSYRIDTRTYLPEMSFLTVDSSLPVGLGLSILYPESAGARKFVWITQNTFPLLESSICFKGFLRLCIILITFYSQSEVGEIY